MTELGVFSVIIVGVLGIILAVLRLRHASMPDLVFGLVGAIVGLMLGALASVPVSKLPEPWGGVLPVVLSVVLTITLTALVLSRKRAIMRLLPFLRFETPAVSNTDTEATAMATGVPSQILVDTSVIIDGRIADIAAAGFVPGKLIVPRFVLAELQNIADSEDAMRRGRGRRGLEVLNRLRETVDVVVEVTDEDVSSIKEVDAKLVALAQKFSCNVLTTDYNLNRVAAIQGVRVLNVNELSNAIRPVVLPGEELVVRVVQPGKERGQGVGYLADGTMIVVENGDKLMGQEVATEVTRVFQTVAGKMIFATPKKNTHQPATIASAPVQPSVADITQRDQDHKSESKRGTTDSKRSDSEPTRGDAPVAQATDEAAATSKNAGRNNRGRRGSSDRKRQNNHNPNQIGSIEDRIVSENNRHHQD